MVSSFANDTQHSVIKLNTIQPNDIYQNNNTKVFARCHSVISVIWQSVILLNNILICVIILSVFCWFVSYRMTFCWVSFAEYHSDRCHCADAILAIVNRLTVSLFNAIRQNVIQLNSVMLNVILQSTVLLNVVPPHVTNLKTLMLSVILFNVI
jgi:hypothetical protein